MKKLIPALVLGLCLMGCSGANSPQIDARALARGSVAALNDAWVAAGDICAAVATAEKNDALRAQCQSILVPVYDSLHLAALAVDGWDATAQKNFPCLIKDIIMGLSQAKVLVEDTGAKLPQLVDDALALASSFAPQCQMSDGGS
jgi:hypothetical protein